MMTVPYVIKKKDEHSLPLCSGSRVIFVAAVASVSVKDLRRCSPTRFEKSLGSSSAGSARWDQIDILEVLFVIRRG